MSFIAVGVTVGAGLVEYGVGAVKAHKAQKALEKTQTPVYKPNQAISDYYQTALQRANTSPYASNFYQQAQKQSDRSLATGIGALQDRHSANMVGALVQGNNDSMQRAGVQAEGLQRQAFGQLGQAANMQNQDYQRQFEQNQEAPYEKQIQIDQAKAIAGSQMQNAGLQSMSSGLGSASQFSMYKQLYGNQGGGANAAAASGGPYGSTAGYYNPGSGPGGLGSAIGGAGTLMGAAF